MSQGFGHLSVPSLDDDEEIDDQFDDLDDVLDEESDSDYEEAEETESPDDGPVVNEWEDRFKGLQASYQQTVEGLRSELAQNQQMSRQAVQQMQAQLFQQQIADLEPEEQAQAWANFQTAVRNQHAMSFLQQQQAQIEQERTFVNQKAQEVAARDLARRYQVPVETLMKFDSPEEMVEVARLAKSRRGKRSKRASNNRNNRSQSRFEGGTAPGRQKQVKKPATIAEAKTLFASLPVPGRQR